MCAGQIELAVLMYRQDDPQKCTASRLVKFRIANEVRRIPNSFVVLNPYSDKLLTASDAMRFKGICGIDCSWNLASKVIRDSKKYSNNRKLPALLAGNPTNYAKLGMLSTVEAISAALYIMGYKSKSNDILNKFRWGHTFMDLNLEILEDYSKAPDEDALKVIEREYFPNYFL